MSVQPQLGSLLDELLMLLHESAVWHESHPAVRQVLTQAGRRVASLRERMTRARRQYVVAVIGLTNVGKSTLMNALLGADMAPHRNGPCTCVPIEFALGPRMCVTATYHDQFERPSWRCADENEVHDHLDRLVGAAARSSEQRIRKVVVEIPNPLLNHGLILSDTPGFGAATADGTEAEEETLLRAYLEREVTQVFWVVLADQGVGKREMSFHERVVGDRCDDLIVTGAEDWDDRDRERFRRRFSEAFPQRIPMFHFVSGLEGLKARASGDSQRLEQAGVTLLEDRIRRLATPHGRWESLEEVLLQLTGDLRYWLCDHRDDRGFPLRAWWRPDSWARWHSMVPIQPLKQHLTQVLQPV